MKHFRRLLKKKSAKKRVLVDYYRSNYYNGVVIAARITQVTRLFSLFTILSTNTGLISVTLIAVENKADNAIDCQITKHKTASFVCIDRLPNNKTQNSEFCLYIIDQIIKTAWLLEVESYKLYDCFRH